MGHEFGRSKAAIYDRWRAPIRDLQAELKAEAKPLWRAQFAEERQSARDRARLERSFGGRLGLSIAAARAQRAEGSAAPERSLVRLVVANFLSRDLREETFTRAAARDRAELGRTIRAAGGDRIGALKEARSAELDRAREDYGRDRAALSERQKAERGEIRAAWREVKRETGRDRERDPSGQGAEDRDRGLSSAEHARVAERPPGGRETRSATEAREEKGRQAATPSKFAWLDRQADGAQDSDRGSKFERSRDAQDRERDKPRDRDRDRGDRER